VWEKVKAFAASKPVFHDKSTPLRVPGSRLLEMADPKKVRQALVTHVGQLPVELSSHEVFYELLHKDADRYLCILNPTAKAVDTRVTLTLPVARVADLMTNVPVPLGAQRTFAVRVEPNHWRVFRLSSE